jgi:Sigma-70, region 4
VSQQTTNRLDRLAPDQRATLALIVGQRKSYPELAAVLGLDEQAVHDRAHAALAMLAPTLARRLTPDQRELVGEHILRGAGAPRAPEVQELLASTPAAGEWAAALEAELAPLSAAMTSERAPARAVTSANGHQDAGRVAAGPERSAAAGERRRPVRSSRLGGAILLVALVAAVVVAVVLISGGGSSGRHSSSKGSQASSGPRITNRFALQATEQGSHAAGAVEILQSGSKRAFYMIASQLPPTHGFYYAIWLYNSASSHEALSRAPAVGSSGSFEGGSFLPENAASYKYILLTRETSSKPSAPSAHVVLGAQFSVGS